MTLTKSAALTGTCFTFLIAAVACANSPNEHFSQGQAKLSDGKLTEAYQSFYQAYRTEPKNEIYRQKLMTVRQILQIQKALGDTNDDASWNRLAMTLHMFYQSQGLDPLQLQIDREMFDRNPTALSAVMLIETLLDQDQEKAVPDVVAKLPAQEQKTPYFQAIHGVALVRLGQVDEAKNVAAQLSSETFNGPGQTFRLARLHAALGSSEMSGEQLAKTFENTAPSQLDGFKKIVAEIPEFAAIADTPAITAAMKTESKIAESSCSGGSSCAGCPMRGKCSGSGE